MVKYIKKLAKQKLMQFKTRGRLKIQSCLRQYWRNISLPVVTLSERIIVNPVNLHVKLYDLENYCLYFESRQCLNGVFELRTARKV